MYGVGSKTINSKIKNPKKSIYFINAKYIVWIICFDGAFD